MRLLIYFISIFVFMRLCQCMQDWWGDNWYTFLNRKRILQLGAQVIEELHRKVNNIRDIRFMYEESPHYEIGYVLAEAMERYRKMVEVVNRLHSRPDQLAHTIRILSEQQYLYQENYNLICMIHEIPRKWAHVEGFETLAAAVETGNISTLHESFEQQKDRFEKMDAYRKRQKRDRKRRLKETKITGAVDELLRQMYRNAGEPIPDDLLSPENLTPENLKKPLKRPIRPPRVWTPKGWLEYGWELNYEWQRK